LFEIIVIVAVFGGILAVFLYKYLLQSPEYKAKSATPASTTPQVMPDDEAVAERVFKLFEKVEDLEADLNNLHLYVSQKVEQYKKKEKAATKQQ
jgi:hypothetical protein